MKFYWSKVFENILYWYYIDMIIVYELFMFVILSLILNLWKLMFVIEVFIVYFV